MRAVSIVFVFLSVVSQLLAVEKTEVFQQVRSTVVDELVAEFPSLKPENVSLEFLNKDAVDIRVAQAKHISVDLIKNQAYVGRRVVRVSLYNEEKVFKNYFSLFVAIKAKLTAVVAKDQIKYGQVLSQENIELGLVEIRNKRSKHYLASLEDAIGKTAIHSHRVGDAFYTWSVEKEKDISKGEYVKGAYMNGSFEIGVTVEILEDANIGDKVKVKVKPNDKVVEAVVKGKNYVEILSGT